MTLWSDIAEWRGPVLHHSKDPIVDHMYVVIHTAQGSYEGTIAWQKNKDSDNSSHFIVDYDGRIAQVNDTAIESGAQILGNPYSIAIENAGNEHTPLTDRQLTANARILAMAHLRHGVPLQLTSRVGTPGLAHHSMGAESGVRWGHSACPGEIIKGQKPEILRRAIAILTPARHHGGDNNTMLFTAKAVPANSVDCTGTDVVETSRAPCPPQGVFSLEYGEIIGEFNADPAVFLPMSWTRLNLLCEKLRQPAN